MLIADLSAAGLAEKPTKNISAKRSTLSKQKEREIKFSQSKIA